MLNTIINPFYNSYVLWPIFTSPIVKMIEPTADFLYFESSSKNIHLFHAVICSILWAKLLILFITVLYINLMTVFLSGTEREVQYTGPWVNC